MSSHTGFDPVTGRAGASAIQGTFSVSLPGVAATTALYSTIVAIPGLTPDHSFAVFNMGVISGATANNSGSTARILFSAQPQVAQATLTYINTGAAVNAGDIVYTFIAVKPLN